MYTNIIWSKREFKDLMTRDGQAGKALQVGEKHHVAWTFPTLHEYNFDCCLVDCGNLPDDVIGNINHPQESDDDDDDDVTLSINQFVQDFPDNESCANEENKFDKHDGQVAPEQICELTLHPKGEVTIIDVAELDDVCEVLEDKEEEENFSLKHTFFDLDQDSMKIISYLDLKKNLEGHLLSSMCYNKETCWVYNHGTTNVQARNSFELHLQLWTLLFHSSRASQQSKDRFIGQLQD